MPEALSRPAAGHKGLMDWWLGGVIANVGAVIFVMNVDDNCRVHWRTWHLSVRSGARGLASRAT